MKQPIHTTQALNDKVTNSKVFNTGADNTFSWIEVCVSNTEVWCFKMQPHGSCHCERRLWATGIRPSWPPPPHPQLPPPYLYDPRSPPCHITYAPCQRGEHSPLTQPLPGHTPSTSCLGGPIIQRMMAESCWGQTITDEPHLQQGPARSALVAYTGCVWPCGALWDRITSALIEFAKLCASCLIQTSSINTDRDKCSVY